MESSKETYFLLFFFAYTQLEKFILVASFFSLPLGSDGMWVRAGYWLTPVIVDWVAWFGVSGPFDAPVLKATFNSGKISWLVFLYRDLGEQIEDPRMFDVTSETRDSSLF